MWGKAKNLLLLLSVAVNVPFILLWAAHAASPVAAAPAASPHADSGVRDSARAFTSPRGPSMPRGFPSRTEGSRSAYGAVGVSEEQWQKIETRLAKFRS